MRLWSLHPRLLDTKGIVAVWREGLLAQKVLLGKTKGYRHHPQLHRFQRHKNPIAAIATYLRAVQEEAHRRGYRFDETKIDASVTRLRISVTKGQISYELAHLKRKVRGRDRRAYTSLRRQKAFLHPLFKSVAGAVEAWEKTTSN